MIAQGSGRIIQTHPVELRGHLRVPPASTTPRRRRGSPALPQALALELAPHGITVNAVAARKKSTQRWGAPNRTARSGPGGGRSARARARARARAGERRRHSHGGCTAGAGRTSAMLPGTWTASVTAQGPARPCTSTAGRETPQGHFKSGRSIRSAVGRPGRRSSWGHWRTNPNLGVERSGVKGAAPPALAVPRLLPRAWPSSAEDVCAAHAGAARAHGSTA